jgi:hypothetical protein
MKPIPHSVNLELAGLFKHPLSGIEHVHVFTRAVSVGNPREFLQAEKEEQEMAEACKRLIKTSRIASSAGITCICRGNSRDR